MSAIGLAPPTEERMRVPTKVWNFRSRIKNLLGRKKRRLQIRIRGGSLPIYPEIGRAKATRLLGRKELVVLVPDQALVDPEPETGTLAEPKVA